MTTTTNTPRSPVRQKGLLSRLTGRSGKILALWLLASALIQFAIYLFVQPTFEAFATVHINPVPHPFYAPAK
jgi:hypothetical protein